MIVAKHTLPLIAYENSTDLLYKLWRDSKSSIAYIAHSTMVFSDRQQIAPALDKQHMCLHLIRKGQGSPLWPARGLRLYSCVSP